LSLHPVTEVAGEFFSSCLLAIALKVLEARHFLTPVNFISANIVIHLAGERVSGKDSGGTLGSPRTSHTFPVFFRIPRVIFNL